MEEEQLKQVLQDLEKCDSITPSAYESLIDQFDVYPYDNYQKMYYTIGYNGEYDELLEKIFDLDVLPIRHDKVWDDIVSEGGDVCWYGTRVSNAFGFQLRIILPHPDKITTVNFKKMMKRVHGSKAKLSESIKKYYRDGEAKMTPEWEVRILQCLRDFFTELQNLALYYGMTLPDMMRANVLKLGKRKLEKKLHGDGDHR